MQDDRWEFRAWPEEASTQAGALATAGKEIGTEVRTDTYFLPELETLLPKVRGGEHFELKELLETRGPCARWLIAERAAFPLTIDSLERLFGAPKLDFGTSLSALIIAAKTATPSLDVVEVHKSRRRFTLEGAEAEITSVRVEGDIYSTIGIEAPSYKACSDWVERLGLVDEVNTDYGEFLRDRLS